MNVDLKEKIAQIYARKGTREAPARWRIPLLFLALLIPAIAGQLAAAEEPASGNYVLVIDVYSGAVPPDVTQEKEFWFGLESVKKGQEPDRVWLPKVIHIDHVLPEKDFDFGGQTDADGQKVVVQGHVSRQADGNLKVAFSELGRPPAYSGKTELTLAPGERRVLRLPIITQPDNRGNLETVAVIWTPALGKDQNGHSRFEVH
jgi:hypothetical protein